jgi:3-methyladenine DNA glycosylase AlkC
MSTEARLARKGFGSRAAIPPDVLARLNAGSEEPQTLAEWLAVDVRRLLAVVLPTLGIAERLPDILQKIADPAAAGVMARQKALGAAFFEIITAHPAGPAIYEGLATYRSGIVREWAALVWTANPSLDIAERLAGARRFAADPSMNVREIAWSSYRPYIAAELDRTLALLTDWVRDEDANVRRCAIESTRPRGVWCAHLNALKDEPSKALPLLEAVRADESRYVQLSLANWLNDASKHQPDWVRGLAERWLAESPSSPTRWIVNHALRTLRKGT